MVQVKFKLKTPCTTGGPGRRGQPADRNEVDFLKRFKVLEKKQFFLKYKTFICQKTAPFFIKNILWKQHILQRFLGNFEISDQTLWKFGLFIIVTKYFLDFCLFYESIYHWKITTVFYNNIPNSGLSSDILIAPSLSRRYCFQWICLHFVGLY